MSNGSQIGGAIGAVVGGIVGFYTGNIAQGIQWGYAIGSAVGGYVDPTQVHGPRLEDAQTQTSSVGGPIPFGYGVFTTTGNIIWHDRVIEHEESDDGKGGGQETITYTYTKSYAIGVCEGPIYQYIWIKKNGMLVYAADPAGLGAMMGWDAAQIADLIEASAEFLEKAVLYYGTEDQDIDPTMAAVEGEYNLSPLLGLAYIVLAHDDVTATQGATGQFEFCVNASPPAVYETSPPYPIEATDAVTADSEGRNGFMWGMSLDGATTDTTFVGGGFWGALETYTVPLEGTTTDTMFVGGGFWGVLETYTVAPDAYDTATTFVGGGFWGDLLEYTHPAEGHTTSTDFVGGEFT